MLRRKYDICQAFEDYKVKEKENIIYFVRKFRTNNDIFITEIYIVPKERKNYLRSTYLNKTYRKSES